MKWIARVRGHGTGIAAEESTVFFNKAWEGQARGADSIDPDRRNTRVTAPRRRILVVDDNEDAVDSLAMMLRLEGHDVSTAYDASGALSAVEKRKPEVVFRELIRILTAASGQPF